MSSVGVSIFGSLLNAFCRCKADGAILRAVADAELCAAAVPVDDPMSDGCARGVAAGSSRFAFFDPDEFSGCDLLPSDCNFAFAFAFP